MRTLRADDVGGSVRVAGYVSEVESTRRGRLHQFSVVAGV